MLEVRPSNHRGRANHGWLQSRHTFSFGHYRDANQQGFSDLLVINDDHVSPGQGFGTHGHRDMEIFSYVLDGALEHKDSMGTGSVIRPGDVQMMSAGTGVEHSEFNHSAQDPVHFLQIWIVPAERGAAPRYQQVHVDDADKRGRLRLIIGPEGQDGTLAVRQDARVYAGLFDGERIGQRVAFMGEGVAVDLRFKLDRRLTLVQGSFAADAGRSGDVDLVAALAVEQFLGAAGR